jgi:hypothetical protein
VKSSATQSFRHSDSISKFLSNKMINFLCSDTKRFRVFDPATTLYCLLFQVLNNCSGKVALGNLNMIRSRNGLKHVSMCTAALVKAKKKIAEQKLKFIARSTGRKIDVKSQNWFYQNRHVYLGDGTVVGLDDTKANRKEFPLTFIKNLCWTGAITPAY